MSNPRGSKIADAILGFLKRPQRPKRPPRGRPRRKGSGMIRPNTDLQGVQERLDDVLEKHHGDEIEEDREP